MVWLIVNRSLNIIRQKVITEKSRLNGDLIRTGKYEVNIKSEDRIISTTELERS